MRRFKFMALLCALVGALSVATSVLAAEKSSSEGKPPPKDIALKGDAVCTQCHDEVDNPDQLAIGKTRHGVAADQRTPTCTSCHGESSDHVKNPQGVRPRPRVEVLYKGANISAADARSGSCLSCHQGSKRIGWQGGTHAQRDVSCNSCHKIHTQKDKVRDALTQPEVCYSCHKEQRAQVARPSRHPIPEGKVTCSSCHNVHGDNPKHLARASVNETCFTCHMEKRGPFVHNHQPVSEDCGICHNPHGTVVANLLKSRPPFLCQECHSHTSHPSQVAGLPTARTTSSSLLGSVGRGCLNCHTNIHGSNSTQNSATAERFRR